MDTDRTAERLRYFAQNSAGQSPLYEHLSRQMAEDERLLEIVRATSPGQPVHLILAAVHYLLLGGSEHPLADFYPSCVDDPAPANEAFPAFRDFCLEQEAALREMLATRRVQTNEVRRCAYLLPAFCYVTESAPGRPLALIEMGTSAGLLLNWDRYCYRYDGGPAYGNEHGSVRIESAWRGGGPPLLERLPSVVDRVGIDIHPVDVRDEEQARWLQSLIWPDRRERMELIAAAIEQFRRTPVRLVAGDGFDLLPGAIQAAPPEATVCVFHCHTLNQSSSQQREQFEVLLAEASSGRGFFELSAEWIHTVEPRLVLVRWEAGEAQRTHLADIDHHGRWIDWRAS